MDKSSLSANQVRIFEFVKEYIETKHISPTVRDICAGTGFTSTSTIHTNLRVLSDKGFIYYTPGVRRAIFLIEEEKHDDKMINIPLVGNVAAGAPILAVDNIQEYISLPMGLVHGASVGDVFMLRIQGESMIEADIFENDLIIVNSSSSISNGDIAVARIDDSVTVKRFFMEDDRVRLQPENSTMEPIYVNTDEVELVGKVVGLIRSF